METRGNERWYVVRTKPRAEMLAATNLARRAIDIYLPKLATTPRHGCHGSASCFEPLFPGYLFAHFLLTEQYHRAAWAPGVRNVVRFGGAEPAPVDDAIIDLLRQRAGGGDVVRPLSVLRPGEQIEVRSGPFAGLLGLIDRPVSGSGRVQVLMEVLRRQTRVDLPAGAVSRV